MTVSDADADYFLPDDAIGNLQRAINFSPLIPVQEERIYNLPSGSGVFMPVECCPIVDSFYNDTTDLPDSVMAEL